jgi:tetratricopeptide (TPR) repeat protein
LNWDTNYGFNKYTDNGYAARFGVGPEHIANGTYLADLSTESVEGYFCFIRGLTFQRANSYADAVAEYRIAITKYQQSPAACNNIAWLFVSVREVQEIVTKEDALQFALKACEIHRTDNNLDTLACVYAEHDDFQSAIEIETEAYNISPQPSYREMIEAFRDGKTWLDVHGVV